MAKITYNEIELGHFQELISSWIVNETLISISFEDLRIYHSESDDEKGEIAKGSITFNPEDNSIHLVYDFYDSSYESRKFDIKHFVNEYQPIIIDDESPSIYTILIFNNTAIGFFSGDEKKVNELLIYLKYWNFLKNMELQRVLSIVETASNTLLLNTDIVNATINFIEMLPSDVFENFYIYTCLNVKKFDLNDSLINYFDDCSVQIKVLSLNLIYNVPENLQILDDIFNTFISFRNVIREYIDIQEEYKDSVVKLLVRHVVYDYFAEKWKAFSKVNPEDYSTLHNYMTTLINNRVIFENDESAISNLAFSLCKDKYYGLTNYPDCRKEIKKVIDEIEETKKKTRFEQRLFQNKQTTLENHSKKIEITDIDLMTGIEFEAFVADLFKKMNYSAKITKESCDQGIDVIAERDGVVIGIQTKCYSSAVGNYAIQEAVAGGRFYQCNKTMVITNNRFTESAMQLARANNVVLWDRDLLIERLIEFFE